MTSERWERIARLYGLALDRPLAERERFLASACTGDLELRRELDSLLNQDVSAAGPIERVAASAGGVWPLPSTELQRRLVRESEVLGRLQHPGIARIYDAGTVENEWGRQPYLAMEFVQGVPLTRYADQHQLDLRGRVGLVVKVCDAVHHAHRRGIVHRDLKPANILVEEDGQPKVLDFGVARILEGGANGSYQTQLGDIVGTLAYMSPEQIVADPSLVDARTDVYALGVILFELLTGRLPYDVGHNVAEAARTIRDEEPASLGTVDRGCRGDLETIVGKATDKNKTLRYASAGELGDDLRRYLEARPIVAVKPTAAYRTRKFIRRHRAMVAAAAAVFTILLLGVAVSALEAIRAVRERDRALRAEEIAAAVNRFLQEDLLAQAGARAQAITKDRPDSNMTVRTALDRAASRLGKRFESQPQVEAAIRRTIGLAYYDLSMYPEAQSQLEQAVEIRRRVLGPQHPDTLTSLDELGVLYTDESRYSDAEAVLTDVVGARQRVLGRNHADTVSTMSHLAVVFG